MKNLKESLLRHGQNKASSYEARPPRIEGIAFFLLVMYLCVFSNSQGMLHPLSPLLQQKEQRDKKRIIIRSIGQSLLHLCALDVAKE